ncbi:MAG: hypothetical protein AB1796_14950 [Bacillota bacterium]
MVNHGTVHDELCTELPTLKNVKEQKRNKIILIPGSRKTRVSPRTIERYLKNYREGGYDALMPKTHTSTTRIPKEYLDLAISLKQENLKRPVTQIIETLELSGKVPQGLLKRSTLYDHFDRLGFTKDLGKKEAKAYQRFSPKHRNQRWQGDTCHEKEKGLAKFAESHWALFDRIQLIRKMRGPDGSDHYYRLDMSKASTRNKVRAIADNHALDKLFKTEAVMQ